MIKVIYFLFIPFAFVLNNDLVTADRNTIQDWEDVQQSEALATMNCDALYEEINGIVVMEVESVDPQGEWEWQEDIENYTGLGYFVWTGGNQFNNPGEGLLEYTIKVNTPGVYRFQWRSRIAQGDDHTEHNDSWLRFPDASDFYAEKNGSIVYPHGSPQGPYPNGSGSDGWFKVYMNQLNQWSWRAFTNDHDGHKIYVEFDEPGVYTMEIAGRSNGHAIDRMVLYNESVSENSATDPDLMETLCENITQIREEDEHTLKTAQIFPNPVGAGEPIQLKIQSPKSVDAVLLISNGLGEQVYREKILIAEGNDQRTIQMDQWGIGPYFLSLQTPDHRIMKTLKLAVLPVTD